MFRLFAVLTIVALLIGCGADNSDTALSEASVEPADMILYNGHVLTVDQNFSQAQAVAVSGDKITAVGSDEDVLRLQSDTTRMIDLRGATVLPGINDAHLHFAMWAFSLNELDLRDKTIEQVQAMLAERAAQSEPGQVIRGVGWSEASLGRLPTKADVDPYTPDNPVVFKEMGHALWVNSKMLELAGIDDASKEPEGVKFERDAATGQLTGVLHEAYDLILPLVPELSPQDQRAAMVKGLQILNQQGVTSFTVPGLDSANVETYRALAADNLLSARVSLHLQGGRSLADAQAAVAKYGTLFSGAGTQEGMLRLRGIKLFMDGAPPGRTALMFDDYPCCPGEKGILLYKGETLQQQIDEINKSVAWLHRQGYQMGIHADGDRSANIAISALIDAMQSNPVEAAAPHSNSLRHYMIHGDLITDEDIQRMADWRIGLTIQPVITYAAGDLLLDLWGHERGERHMATGLFINAGVPTNISTDAPIVPPDWKQNIEYAVLRENQTSPGTMNGSPDYAISVEQALIASTRTPAYQDFQEAVKGTLEVGKYADLVVIDKDILSIDPHAISDIQTLLTLVGGKVVYAREGAF